MSGYCPAGKCECEKYDNGFCYYGRTPLAPMAFSVCVYFTERIQDAKLKEARTSGRLAGLREAREAVEKLKPIKSWESDGEKFTDIWIDIDNRTRSAALAAIDGLMEPK